MNHLSLLPPLLVIGVASQIWWSVNIQLSAYYSECTTCEGAFPSFTTLPYEITAAFDPSIVSDKPLVEVNCTKFPFLMHKTDIVDWVCKQEGERKVTQIMLHLFQTNQNGLMLDIGANSGFYGLLAAKLGHRVIQFDLQPTCQRMLRNAVLVNGFQKTSKIIAAGISDISTRIRVPDQGCDGQFPAKQNVPFSNHTEVFTPVEPLNKFVDPNKEILLIKVDTEGNEQRVLAGAMEFFRNGSVRNAIVELTPGFGFWENAGITKEEVVQTLQQIVQSGYWMVSLHDYTVHRTAEQVEAYLERPKFGQADVWLTNEQATKALVGHVDRFDVRRLNKR